MLKQWVIEPAQIPWSSPIVLVKKKDGKWQFCIDYSRLNEVTTKDVYPLPRIDDTLSKLEGAALFSVVDLQNGYCQVPVPEAGKPKTAFVTPDPVPVQGNTVWVMLISDYITTAKGYGIGRIVVDRLPGLHG
ncbi:Uncharacterized protein APZ42_029955 [Daphnia magna]|uniref:Reverse transcriptase domain-containing protein n=1 Tax=Daphnia magna TaxID=35525 RepID=A0A164P688_9CRUS|nr:Uncharacterized protein APZ42_029955 [Daphnia magna]